MTLRLILMRHAKSSWDDLTLADHDRSLNARGQASAVAMGHWLKSNTYVPNVALSSSSRRTRETFAGLGLDTPIAYLRSLYMAGPETMMEALRSQMEPVVLMLAHNPGIADFARRLIRTAPPHPRFADYPTCATGVIDFEAHAWPEIHWGSGVVTDFAVPREVLE